MFYLCFVLRSRVQIPCASMISFHRAIAYFIFVILICILINPTYVKTRQIIKPNWKLDIVLMFDESTSMRRRDIPGSKIQIDLNFIQIAVREWFQQYAATKGSEESRFAVIGCKGRFENQDVEPYLYLDGSGVTADNLGAKVLWALQKANDTMYGDEFGYDNVGGCPKSVVKNVFQENKGDRPDALNVVFYITDCFFDPKAATADEMHKLFAKTAAFLLICAEKQSYRKDHNEIWPYLKDLVNNDVKKIYEYQSNIDTIRHMNEILPTIVQNVVDCDYKGFSTTPYCQKVPMKGCVKITYPNIIQLPDSSPEANKCPDNTTTPCGTKDCDCDKNEWKEVKCCDGTKISERDVSHQPSCESKKTEKDDKCSDPCSGIRTTTSTTTTSTLRPPDPTTTTATTKSRPPIHTTTTTRISSSKTTRKRTRKPRPPLNESSDSTKDIAGMNYTTYDYYYELDDTTTIGHKKTSDEPPIILYIIFGIIGGILLLLLLLLLLFLLLRRRRRKKKTQVILLRHHSQKKHHGHEAKPAHHISAAKQHGDNKGVNIHRDKKEKGVKADIADMKKHQKQGKGLDKTNKGHEKGLKADIKTPVASKVSKKGTLKVGKKGKTTQKKLLK